MITFFACCFLAAAVASAGEMVPDISGYSRPEAKIVFEENFNSDISRWVKPKNQPGFSVQPHVGVIGSPALMATSTGKANLPSWHVPVKVIPGKAYRVSFRYRLANLKSKDNSRRHRVIVCSLHRMKDKDTRKKLRDINFWVPSDDTSDELRFYSSTVVIPKNATGEATFSVHVDWWLNGTFIYDDFSIATQEVPAELQLAYPDRMTMDAQGKISVRYQCRGGKVPDGAEMIISAGKVKKLAKSGKGLFSASFGKFSGEKVNVSAVLFNRKQRRIIAEHRWELNNVQAVPVSYLDEHGRLIFNGKPFMPLGSYIMMPMNDEHLGRLKEAGFNLIQVQPMTRLPGLVGKPSNENTSKKLLSYIEYASRFGLKTLMFLQLMIPEKEFIRNKYERTFNGETSTDGMVREIGKTLRGNPNVAGYYLSDENTADELPSVQILRQKINSADPTHITTTLTCSTEILDQYVSTGDILLYDFYPFNSQGAPGKKGDLVGADWAFAKIAALNTPFWLVPQGFDWARHPQRHMYGKTAEEKLRHRIPSAEELTALPLLGAIYGAKGFVFYSYHEVFKWGEKVQSGFGKIFWPRIVEAVRTLKMLEPFIMSTEKADPIKLEAAAGALRSRTFAANGKTAVVIVALKDAPNAGKGILPSGKKFVSIHGRSKINGKNFTFSSSGVDYDILISQ